MREALVILLVLLVVLGLTAFRYRKQIAGMIQVARLLRDAKNNIAGAGNRIKEPAPKAGTLVNCEKCGVWVPENKAVRSRTGHLCKDCS